jgi:regulatory protein
LARAETATAKQNGQAVALRLLERRLRSRAELEMALRRRGIPAADVLAVVGELRRAGWIDDVRFAKSWIADRLALSPRGRRRLRIELLARGVSATDADEALAALLPSTTEQALALEQARRGLHRLRHLPPSVARRRLIAWLRRRGFGAETIAQVLRTETASGEEGDPAV